MLGTSPDSPRFNVLLAEDPQRADADWATPLSRLLKPQGFVPLHAESGHQALELAEKQTLHAALIDLATPRHPDKRPTGGTASPESGGLWLLEVLHRRPDAPPIVVVNNQRLDAAAFQRYVNAALQLGAFSVLNFPVRIEALLTVIRKLIDRRYQGNWPELQNN
ncbi:response regulator [Mucisphaera sp.]|uniref:response regulator n=1 Tax=Mucisphaera sp. TaxID=2913024 RepID=UPI003D14873B